MRLNPIFIWPWTLTVHDLTQLLASNKVEIFRLQYCCYKNLDFVKHKQLKEDYNQKEKREQHLRVHEKWIQDKINRKEAILARQKQIQEKKGSVKTVLVLIIVFAYFQRSET